MADMGSDETEAWLPNGLAEGSLGAVVRRSLVKATHAADNKAFDAVVDGLMAYLSDWETAARTLANQNTGLKLRETEIKPLFDMAELMWGLACSVTDGHRIGPETQNADWQEAFVRARTMWHAQLELRYGAPGPAVNLHG